MLSLAPAAFVLAGAIGRRTRAVTSKRSKRRVRADHRATLERLRSLDAATEDDRRQAAAAVPSRAASRQYQRYVTTAPPLVPPALRCPECDTGLLFEESYVGGVTQKFSEQWDRFRCPDGCGSFQYRHRTRQLRRRSGPC